jgi:tRNA threonylcarbamoyladenosine modification (KEOPS) complex  Pcc1 subunit
LTELSGWEGTLEILCPSGSVASRLYRVLAPEASREVPRARAELLPPSDRTLTLRLFARDTGAVRAAVQTYLGWVHLAGAAARAGGASDPAL